MFGLFKKKKEPEVNFAAIGTDMHSHILPGIDDGAQNVEASIILAILSGFTKESHEHIIICVRSNVEIYGIFSPRESFFILKLYHF